MAVVTQIGAELRLDSVENVGGGRDDVVAHGEDVEVASPALGTERDLMGMSLNDPSPVR